MASRVSLSMTARRLFDPAAGGQGLPSSVAAHGPTLAPSGLAHSV